MKTKKKVFTKNGTLFSPTSSTDLRSDAHHSQIIGGDAEEDRTQIVGGGIQSGGIQKNSSPLGFGTPTPDSHCLRITPLCSVYRLNETFFERKVLTLGSSLYG